MCWEPLASANSDAGVGTIQRRPCCPAARSAVSRAYEGLATAAEDHSSLDLPCVSSACWACGTACLLLYLPAASLLQVLSLRALLNKHCACHTISRLHHGRAQPVTVHTAQLGILLKCRFWWKYQGTDLRFSISNKLLGDAPALGPLWGPWSPLLSPWWDNFYELPCVNGEDTASYRSTKGSDITLSLRSRPRNWIIGERISERPFRCFH